MEKKKLKIYDFDGRKLDTVIITSSNDADKLVKRWKLKGWF